MTETNNNIINKTIDNLFDNNLKTNKIVESNSDNISNINKNNLKVDKERLNLLVNNRNVNNLNNKSNNYLDLHENYDSISFKDNELKKTELFKNFKKEKFLEKYLDNYVNENLKSEETSDLGIKNYDENDMELYMMNVDEYDYIKSFIYKGKYISIKNKNNIKESKCGRIIVDSYYRFLDNKNRIDIEINEFLRNVDFDDYRTIKYNKTEYGFVLLNLQEQYKFEILERYKYFGTILICKNDKEMFRIPLYLDNNLDFCILTYRKIVKNYFSFINISKLLAFIDINTTNNSVRLTCIERFNVFSYKILQKGLIQYFDYDSYNNEDFLDNLYTLEEDSY